MIPNNKKHLKSDKILSNVGPRLLTLVVFCAVIHQQFVSLFTLSFSPHLLNPLSGLDQIIGPPGERVYVFLPQQRGNPAHTQTWQSRPPQRRPAGLVAAGHHLSCIQTVCAARPVSETNSFVFSNGTKKKTPKKTTNLPECGLQS